MDYEKIILELFSRVKELEGKVATLENKISSFEKNDNINESTEDGTKITRSISRRYVMDKLQENNPNFKISKGNRASGADIILTTKRKEITYTLKSKFYHSKSYNPDYVSGWITINKNDITNEDIQFHIFNIEYEKKYYTFFFETVDLLAFIQDKSTDQNDMYHFYFHIKGGKMVECRDDEKDVSQYYNTWTLPTKFIEQ